MYPHEAEWKKPSAYPMCTAMPTVDDSSFHLYEYLKQRNLSYSLALMNGWYQSRTAGDTFPRVVIPAITHVQGHVYWQARDMTGKAYLRYQSPKGPRHEALVHTTPEDEDDPLGVVIVEGPMDALAAACEGYAGIALMGMTPSRSTIEHLASLLPKDVPILVLLDRDSASSGPRLSWKLASRGVKSHVALLPGPEKDLCQCLPTKRKKFLASAFRSSYKLSDSVPAEKHDKPAKRVRSTAHAGKPLSSR